MGTVNISAETETISCQKNGCSNSENMIVSNAFRQSDGSYSSALQMPENWVRMLKYNDSGRAAVLKLYCPTCSAGL